LPHGSRIQKYSLHHAFLLKSQSSMIQEDFFLSAQTEIAILHREFNMIPLTPATSPLQGDGKTTIQEAKR